jgi:hypothetical protein
MGMRVISAVTHLLEAFALRKLPCRNRVSNLGAGIISFLPENRQRLLIVDLPDVKR